MNAKNRRLSPGFSLIELLVGLAVLGIALSIAIPSFGEAKQKQIVSAAAEKFAGDIQAWRSSAIKQSKPVVVSIAQTNGGQSWCYGASDTSLTGCDCMNANSCRVENNARVINQADFGNVSVTINNWTGSILTLQPRGFVDTPNAQVSFASGNKTVLAKIGSTGKVSLCSSNVNNYSPC